MIICNVYQLHEEEEERQDLRRIRSEQSTIKINEILRNECIDQNNDQELKEKEKKRETETKTKFSKIAAKRDKRAKSESKISQTKFDNSHKRKYVKISNEDVEPRKTRSQTTRQLEIQKSKTENVLYANSKKTVDSASTVFSLKKNFETTVSSLKITFQKNFEISSQ
jgi:hypothetical protein